MRSCVILLHGLCRTPRSMVPLKRFLEASGCTVRNIAYPSTKFPLQELAKHVRPKIEAIADQFDCIHFVTHSMGGILLRQLVADGGVTKLGRCVMLAPPSRGSHVVDRLGSWAIFSWLNGPAGCELGTSEDSLPAKLGPVDFEVGVIAGTRSINWILSLLLPSPNDGKVAVSHARLEGQRAFLALPVSHPFIMKNRIVQENTLAFLKSGRFLLL